LQQGCIAKPGYTFGAPNSLPKLNTNVVISPRILSRFDTKVLLVCGEVRISGITARRGENQADFLVFLAAGMVEREDMRKKKPRKERERERARGGLS